MTARHKALWLTLHEFPFARRTARLADAGGRDPSGGVTR